jgi:hypothetical protein
VFDFVRALIWIERQTGKNSSGASVIIIIITHKYNHSSASESESPWASRANNDPSSAPMTKNPKKTKNKLKNKV